jgi:hypothetical protein
MSVTTVKQIADDVAALAHDDGEAGRYLTDGVGLYRMLGPLELPGEEGAMVGIEDCWTLELVLVTPAQLESWEMRPVLAAA